MFSICLLSTSDSTLFIPDTQSLNSSKAVIATGFRFDAEMYSYFFNARFLVIRPINAENMLGFWPGIAFHKAKYVEEFL